MRSTRSASDSHRPLAAGVALAVLSATVLLSAGPASAAKPSGGGGGGGKTTTTSTMTLVLLDPSDGVVNHGDQIRFDVSSTATTQPHVSVKCYQSGALVYSAQTGYYEGYKWPNTQIFTLDSGAWQSGVASCTATLYWFSGTKTVVGKTMDFPVAE